MNHRSLIRFLLGVTLFAVAVPATAAVSLWRFQGLFSFLPQEYQALGLTVGDPLFGVLRVNRNALDAYPTDPSRGQYDLINASVCVPGLSSCWVFAGTQTAHVITVLNDVPNDPPWDFFEAYMRDIPLDSNQDPTRLFVFNGRAPASLFPSDALPGVPPLVSGFEFLNFQYTDFGVSNNASATGRITAFYRIPEPGTLFLLVAAALTSSIWRTRSSGPHKSSAILRGW